MVAAKVSERLTVSKQRYLRFNMERSSLKNLNEVEGKKQYHIEVSSKFADIEDLDAEMLSKSDLKITRKNVKISIEENESYYKLKKHKL
jgi:hypothetical protein